MKDVVLVLRDERFPQLHVLLSKVARAWLHDVVRVNVIISECRYDRDRKWVLGVRTGSENIDHLFDGPPVEVVDFRRGTRELDIVVVSRRVSSPNHKIDLLHKIVSIVKLWDTCRGGGGAGTHL